jgi:hypothetical protein
MFFCFSFHFALPKYIATDENNAYLNKNFPDSYEIDLGENSNLEGITSEISFCIVDLKFDEPEAGKPEIKICEFGEGLHSMFGRSEVLFGNDGCVWY